MNDQPGLFDLAGLDVAAPARSGRGRARETYARTVVADVTIQNSDTLRAAALRAFSGGIVLLNLPSDEPDDLPDTQEEITTSDAAAVQWCLETYYRHGAAARVRGGPAPVDRPGLR